MLLFFDTETTGFANFKQSPDHPSQPHLVQLAALLAEDDGTERASLNVIVRPDGFEIPEAASNVHGITTELAERVGVPLSTTLNLFVAMACGAQTLVAHNVDFDVLVMEAELSRQDGEAIYIRQPTFCTMRTATPICKIPHAVPRRPGDYKWPKLAECIRFFFDEELEGAHDALVDVRACKQVYFALKQLEQKDAA